MPADLPDEQRAERLALLRRTLFVGMTRARDRLHLVSAGKPCEVIDAASRAMDLRRY